MQRWLLKGNRFLKKKIRIQSNKLVAFLKTHKCKNVYLFCPRSENATKYTNVGSDKDLACSIGYAESGKIYIQVKPKIFYNPVKPKNIYSR